MRDIALVLKKRMGAARRERVPTWQLPNWMVRIAALRDPGAKQILPDLGKKMNATNAKAKRVLSVMKTRASRQRQRLVRLGLLTP